MKHMTRRLLKGRLRRAKTALTALVLIGCVVWAMGAGALAAYDYKMEHRIDVFPGIDMLPDEDIARWRDNLLTLFH